MTSALSTTSPPKPLTVPRPRRHLAPVPVCEPPFDDEAGALLTPRMRPAFKQAWAIVPGAPVVDWTVPTWSQDPDIGVTRTSASDLPDPNRTAGVIARALIESLAGYRPVTQLRASCSPEVYAALRPRTTPAGPPPKLLSIRTSAPTDGVAEATAIFRRGTRAAAMAFRLQGIDGRWRITALQIG